LVTFRASPEVPVRSTLPLIVTPLTLNCAPPGIFAIIRSPLNTTPVKSPLCEGIKEAPASVTVPPLILPFFRYQSPVTAFKVSVVPVLSRVPTRVTVLWGCSNLPKPAVVNVPPRFALQPVRLMVPALVHRPGSLRKPPTFTVESEPVTRLELVQLPPRVR